MTFSWAKIEDNTAPCIGNFNEFSDFVICRTIHGVNLVLVDVEMECQGDTIIGERIIPVKISQLDTVKLELKKGV